MKLFFFFLFLLFNSILRAQPTIQWQKCLGGSHYDRANSIQQTIDGGYIIAGYTDSSDGDVSTNMGLFDIWIVKLDGLGIIQWEKTFGGSAYDWAGEVKQTNDGGYLIVGYTESNDGDVTGNLGGMDGWILKLNYAGELEWQKTLGGSGDEAFNSIELTPDGGFIIAGKENSTDGDVIGNQGYYDFWILKFSSLGSIEWQQTLGGSDEETALSIKTTSEGGYIVAGETKSNDGDVSGNNGNVDQWVVKLNSYGEIEWQRTIGGSGLDVASDIAETPDGFMVCGYAGSNNTGDVQGNHGFFDFWIVKLDKSGEFIWQKCLGGTKPDYGRSIITTLDGMLVLVGEVKSTDGDVEVNSGVQMIWVVKINQLGDIIWKMVLGGTQGEGCFSAQQSTDLGLVLGGYSWSNDGNVSGNHGGNDFWVVKLAPESSATSSPTIHPLSIYPNPAHESIRLDLPLAEAPLSIRISDLLGRELKRETYRANSDISVSDLPGGFYLLTATTDFGAVYTGKFYKN